MSDNATMKNTTIHDMTTGSPARLIMQFMIPMFLGNIFQQFYNIADSIIAGQFLGVRALAAIGSTGSLMFFVTGWLNGLSSGFAILVSQWFGAKEYERMRHYVAMSIYLSAGWAVLMTIGLGIANEPILRLMNYKDSIMPDVKAYMGIIYAGLIVTAAYNALAAFLRALGDSKSPLYFLIISAVINVGLDVAFIIYGGMGVEGCAYATVIAQGISAVLALVTLFSRLRSFAGEEKQPFFDRGYFTQIFAIAVPSILQQSVLSVGNLFVQDIVNRYGSAVVAGYSGAIKLNTFAINIFMTLGSCLSSYTAQNIGAGKAERIPLGFRTGLKLSAVATVPFVVLYVGFSRRMMGLFLNAESGAAITAGMEFLRIVAPWYLMIVVKLMTDGIIRGAGAMTYFVAATVPDLIIRILFALMFSRNYGSTGIWMAWPFGWIAATVLTLVFYRKVRRQSGDLA